MTAADRLAEGSDRGDRPSAPRSPFALAILVALASVTIIGLVALGVWQSHRLSWKLDLIARVDRRIHAPPVPPPDRDRWPGVDAAADEYRHVSVSGSFDNDRETLVQAVTELGAGFWVVTPLRTATGATILVNRGFVPPDRRDPASRAAGRIDGVATVTGLLRMSEPKGGFLRSNDAAGNRWYSRDVAAIAAARGLADVAPYFIDADGTPNKGEYPVGGLTVVTFANNHLVYAITWFSLAAMLTAAVAWLLRDERRRIRRAPAVSSPARL